ncbi:MAG: hypothetical protein M1365_16115 [Actinobacteria bacterium]|nr:hypothetical protein [Actinomycetota bacterium]
MKEKKEKKEKKGTLKLISKVALMAFTVAICFFHNKSLHALDNKELLEKDNSNLYTRFILGYY